MKKKPGNKFGTVIAMEEAGAARQGDIFNDKVPIERLREIWNDETTQYSDEELYKIRDWMYAMAGVIIQVAEKQTPSGNNVRAIKPTTDETKESHIIRESEYRRAS
jgi:hypothetical protein